MKRARVLLGLLSLLAILVCIQFLREHRMERKRSAIETLLGRDPRFRQLSVETMKPGWHRIRGNVASTNDIADLKNLVRTNGITNCTFFVDFDH